MHAAQRSVVYSQRGGTIVAHVVAHGGEIQGRVQVDEGGLIVSNLLIMVEYLMPFLVIEYGGAKIEQIVDLLFSVARVLDDHLSCIIRQALIEQVQPAVRLPDVGSVVRLEP